MSRSPHFGICDHPLGNNIEFHERSLNPDDSDLSGHEHAIVLRFLPTLFLDGEELNKSAPFSFSKYFEAVSKQSSFGAISIQNRYVKSVYSFNESQKTIGVHKE